MSPFPHPPPLQPVGNPFAEPGLGGGGASDTASVASTSAGDVEVDPGKRSGLGFKKSPARIILP